MSRMLQVVSFLGVLHAALSLEPTSPYATGPINLTDTATLYHEANTKDNSIRLAIIIKDPTAVVSGQNWLGMGIGESSSGSMIGADIVTAQFATNATTKCSIEDRYVPFVAYPLGENPRVYPFEDECKRPDWHLVSCVRDVADGSMMLEVTRSLSVADEKQDRSITPGPNAFLHAYGNAFSYHGNSRHSAEVIFYEDPDNPLPSTDLPDDVDGSFVIAATAFEIPNDRDTVYACTSMRIPNIGNGTNMIIAAEPVFNSSDEDTVHHFTLFMCGSDKYARQTSKTVTCDIRKPLGPLGNDKAGCATLVFGYAKGSTRFIYPPDVGLSVTEQYPYLVMETHFDNPQQRGGLVDHSGVRVYYTSKKRKHSASSLALGDTFVSRAPAVIRNDFRYQNSCPSECTSRFSQSINIFSSFLHMHTTGQEIYTNLYEEDNTFVQTVNKINFWSDSFQKFKLLPQPVQVQPGQRLQTVCRYDTEKRPNTKFGLKTTDEMCMDFLMYWPAQTDPVTGHVINTCAYFETSESNSTMTICGEHGRLSDMFAENATGFPTNISNPTFNDTVGAPTEFGDSSSVCRTPSPTPTTSATPNDEKTPTTSTNPNDNDEASNECFPAFATVTKRDGSKVRMDSLSIGEIIAVGRGHFSPVFMFTHADASAISEMVQLKTDRGSLTLSKGHYVYLDGSLKPARQASVGEKLFIEGGGEVTVVAKDFVTTSGLYNPQTLHGDIVVDGFVSSTFTDAVEPAQATALLAPLRWSYSAICAMQSLVSDR